MALKPGNSNFCQITKPTDSEKQKQTPSKLLDWFQLLKLLP